MANIKSASLVTLLLVLAVSGDHCVDEKNNFRIVEVEFSESPSHPNQAIVTVTGFFDFAQYVNVMTFDYSLDGVNWIRATSKVNQEFQPDIFSVFSVSISIEEQVSPNAQAVVGFAEESELVWCSLIKLMGSYEKRRLLG
jgi:hypothetical protein